MQWFLIMTAKIIQLNPRKDSEPYEGKSEVIQFKRKLTQSELVLKAYMDWLAIYLGLS